MGFASCFKSFLPLGLPVALLAACPAHGDPPVLPEPSVLRLESASGRFVVLGPKAVRRMGLTQWAEVMAARVEEVTGIPLPSRPELVRIAVVETEESDSGAVRVESGWIGGRYAQRLVLTDPEAIPGATARLALCEALIRLSIGEARGENADAAAEPSWREDPHPPAWLLSGVARNCFAGQRARNSEVVFDHWRHGRLPPVASLLIAGREARPFGDLTEDPNRYAYGLLIRWFKERFPEGAWFRAACGRLAAEEALSVDWLVQVFPDCRSPYDLDDRWDAWVLRQRLRVHRPGATPLHVMERLRGALLLYPEDFGMPLTGNLYRRARIHDLVRVRHAPWLQQVVADKQNELRVLAVGRGEAFRRVVEAYCSYLDAVGSQWSWDDPRELLHAAQQAHRQLQYQLQTQAEQEAEDEDEED